jgi:hypothetical protein
MTTWKNGPGSQVNAASREIAAARQGVSPAGVQMAEPATGPLSSAEKQKAAGSAASAVQSRQAPANSTSPFKR